MRLLKVNGVQLSFITGTYPRPMKIGRGLSRMNADKEKYSALVRSRPRPTLGDDP
jgi:hypothetical protein